MADAEVSNREFWKVKDAAQRLSVSPDTVMRRIAAGDLETVTIGRSRLIVSESLAKYVEMLRGRR